MVSLTPFPVYKSGNVNFCVEDGHDYQPLFGKCAKARLSKTAKAEPCRRLTSYFRLTG